jgi:hypothetical protein
MKKLIFLSFLVLIVLQPVLAQKKMELTKIYVQAGAGGSTKNGFSAQLGLRSVFNNKWTFTASAMYLEREAQAPGDYVGYSSGSWWMGDYYHNEFHPIARTDFYYLSAGRFFPLLRSVYFTVDAGLGMANGQEFSYIRTNGTLNSSYDYSYSPKYAVKSTDKSAFGGIIRTGFDWAFSGIAGIGIDAYYNYNTGGINDNLGFNIKLIVGWMNRGRKLKIQ